MLRRDIFSIGFVTSNNVILYNYTKRRWSFKYSRKD